MPFLKGYSWSGITPATTFLISTFKHASALIWFLWHFCINNTQPYLSQSYFLSKHRANPLNDLLQLITLNRCTFQCAANGSPHKAQALESLSYSLHKSSIYQTSYRDLTRHCSNASAFVLNIYIFFSSITLRLV